MSAAERGASLGALRPVRTGGSRGFRLSLAPGSAAEEAFRISVSCHAGYTVVRPSGELDLSTVELLETSLLDQLERGARELVLDLRHLEFCDAAGLQVFLRVRRRAIAGGARLSLEHPERTVRRVLEVSELGWLIDESPTRRATG